MLDLRELEDLIGFRYHSAEPAGGDYPFLLRCARMGCDLHGRLFEISRREDYPYFTLHLVFSGCSFFHIAGRDYLLKKGDAFLILAGEAHTYRNLDGTELGYLWIELNCDAYPELVSYFKLGESRTIDAAYTEPVARQLLAILRAVRQREEQTPFELSAMYYALLMRLAEAGDRHTHREAPRMITAALHYIHSHFAQELPVGRVAEYLNVSLSCLTKQFRRYIGTSPAQYVCLKRAEYAAFLLRDHRLTCEQIVQRAGFCDAAHLHKTLVRLLGRTPTQLRPHPGEEKSGGVREC